MEPQRGPAPGLCAATAARWRLCRPGGAWGPRTRAQAGQATATARDAPTSQALPGGPQPAHRGASSGTGPRSSARVLITGGGEGTLGEPKVLQDDLPCHRTSEIPIATSAKELPMSHEVNFYTNRETKTNRQIVSTHLCVCGRAGGGGVGMERKFPTESATEILLYQRILHQRRAWKLGAHAEGPTDPEASKERVLVLQSRCGPLILHTKSAIFKVCLINQGQRAILCSPLLRYPSVKNRDPV